MSFKKLIAISGTPGIHVTVATRRDGVIVDNVQDGKRQFYSARKHQFTPLDSISIFTTGEEDTVPLKAVLQRLEGMERPAPNAGAAELRAFFKQVLPEHDEERVYVSDIKKLLKWYEFMLVHDLLHFEDEDEQEGSEEAPAEGDEEAGN